MSHGATQGQVLVELPRHAAEGKGRTLELDVKGQAGRAGGKASLALPDLLEVLKSATVQSAVAVAAP